ncbi:hypothetical protein ACFQ8E_02790 [Isoptericola sp. NPDC056573]|uniref:hypothetical protein n=1 Tax=Isoptericola sp. NPDC056573 TaxID=3345868 RepID=UPI00368A51B0
MNEMTSRDLAVLAELDYRRERMAETYQRGTPAWVRTVGRVAGAAGRGVRDLARRARSRAADREAVQRLGSTLDAVAARTDARAWDLQVTRRADQIAHGLDALRPQDGAGRRAA